MTRQIDFKFPLTNGLHARPASQIQEVARRFHAAIYLENGRTKSRADSKSVLSLITAEIRKEDPCRIIISGEDEAEAETALKPLLEKELLHGENETPDIPLNSTQEVKIPRVLRKGNPRYFAGTGVCGGIGRAAAFILNAFPLEPPVDSGEAIDQETEIRGVQEAVNRLILKITQSIEGAQNPTEKNILTAHLAILQDKNYLETIINHIKDRNYPGAKAVFETAQYFIGVLQRSKNDYIRQRLSDIKDISAQVIVYLTGGGQPSVAPAAGTGILKEPAIVLAENILPSQFIALDKKFLKGLVLTEAGTTSHSIILARAFNIPTITGVNDIHNKLNPGEAVIIDAGRGLVIPSPNSTLSRFYEQEIEKERRRKERTASFIPGPGVTADGKNLEIGANIGSAAELEAAFLNGADGIGLFRTEWLFMDKPNAPTEAEQCEIYSRAATAAGNRPVIIRTLDIGADKPVPYLDLPRESNPFLGNRGIRLYNDFPGLITTQLRAILRSSAASAASTPGNLKIMFPMVCSLEEVLSLKKQLKAVMVELEQEGLPFNPGIPVGIMIETPAVAFALEEISKEVDFFSIGSNDLTQYFLAADRGNPKVSDLYNTFYPSFLRLLKKISTGVHGQGKWLGLCGELAGNIEYLPLWVGLGFDEISLSSFTIPAIKAALRKLKAGSCQKQVARLTKTTTAKEFQEVLGTFSRPQTDVPLITEEMINLESASSSRDEAIRESVNLLELTGRIENSDEVEDLVWKREEAYPTAIGFGIAIPHCQGATIKNNSIAFLKLKEAIQWESLDDQPVDLVFLLAIQPSEQGQEHLKILAQLSRKLVDEDFVAQLRSITEPAGIISLIKNVYRK